MTTKLPDIGTKRIVRRFAWIPRITDDNYRVWLAWYWAEQRYQDISVSMEGDTWRGWVTIGTTLRPTP